MRRSEAAGGELRIAGRNSREEKEGRGGIVTANAWCEYLIFVLAWVRGTDKTEVNDPAGPRGSASTTARNYPYIPTQHSFFRRCLGSWGKLGKLTGV